jgi:hypothetical protein
MPKPSHSRLSPSALSRPYGWLEVLAMKHDYGIRVDPSAKPATVEAAVVQRLYAEWVDGSVTDVWPLTGLFFAIKAEYLHLSRDERSEKLPAFILAALNDPHGGILVASISGLRRGHAA